MKPFKYQEKAVTTLMHMLTKYKGAILRADERTGKTFMTSALLHKSSYGNILWVCKGGVRKPTIDEIEKCKQEASLVFNYEVVSYQKFARMDLSKYAFLVVDECHMLSKWNAGWTKKFVMSWNKPFLCLSATPVLQSPLDYLYTLRKTGVFGKMSTNQFKIKFFGAVPSNYGDFLEVGEFQNKTEFNSYRNRVSYDITQETAFPGFPPMNIDIEIVPGEFQIAKDLTEETASCVASGVAKAEDAAHVIKDSLRKDPYDKVLVYTRFHDTAKAIYAQLYDGHAPITLALDARQTQAAFEKMKTESGILITTFGLTCSGLSLNACDRIFAAESTYSWLLDRQSFRRTQAPGKENAVKVTYIAYENETPLIKSLSRKWLETMGEETQEEHSKLGPSSLKTLQTCPGSYWMENTASLQYAGQAYFGNLAHKELEYYIENPLMEIPEVSKELRPAVKFCRQLSEGLNTFYRCEERVSAKHIHPDFFGTVDFFSYCPDTNKLHIVDYKNGSYQINVRDNLQLHAYTQMILETYNDIPLEGLKVYHTIFQKETPKTISVPKEKIKLMRDVILGIISHVERAEYSPHEYLDEDCTDPFCRAYINHERARLRGENTITLEEIEQYYNNKTKEKIND